VPRCIVLDIDDTDDAVHGQQQLALFNTMRRLLLQPIRSSRRRPAARAVAAAPGKRHRARKSSKSASRHRSHPSQLAAVEIMVRATVTSRRPK